MKAIKYITILALVLVWIGCIDQDAYENATFGTDQKIAIPIIDSEVSIGTVVDKVGSEGTAVKIDDQGKITLFYNGEVVRQTSKDIFPPVPGLTDYPLPDTNSLVPLPIEEKYDIHKGEFGDTQLFFNFRHEKKGNYKVKMTLPQMTKDGKVWSKDYDVEITDEPNGFFTELTSLKGTLVIPEDNKIRFVYEAYNEDGEKIKFDYASMRVDVLEFDYLEGYFAYQVFDIDGSDIGIGLFDEWVSGGIEFDDPRMNIVVENSIGFPVRSKINFITLSTLSNGELNLESEYIDKGIDFGYPTIEERGEIKQTSFSFSQQNSNIKELFKDKIVELNYDIDAIANPDKDTEIVNFVDSNSYFTVDVNVEIPLLGAARYFVVKNDSEADLSELEDAKSVEFKTIIENQFPADVKVQLYFMDDNNKILDSLFDSSWFIVEAAELGSDQKTTNYKPVTKFTEVTEEKLTNILESTKVETHVGLNNTEDYSGNLWLYDDYSVSVKLGALIQLK